MPARSAVPVWPWHKPDPFFPNDAWAFGFGNLSVAIVRDARQALHEGKIIAVKGLGGFLFACDAQNEESVRLLR